MIASPMSLPPIPLSALPEKTKDYLIAYCHQRGCSFEEAMKQTLDASAARAGFAPQASTQPEDTVVHAVLMA